MSGNSKVSLDVKTWMMLMGMMLTAIITLSTLAMVIFKTQTAAALDHGAHETLPAHAVQLNINKNMHETNTAQQTKIDAVHDNVLKIGVRLRIKELKRIEEE